MQHFPDRSTMQVPGICFVCERTPDEGTGYVDTLTNFTPGFPSALAGAKYICDACVKAAAEAAGHYATETVEDSYAQRDAAIGRLNAVLDHVAETIKSFGAAALSDVADRAPVVAAQAAEKASKASKSTKASDASESAAA